MARHALTRPGSGGERDRALAFVAANDRAVAGELVELGGDGPSGWAVLDRGRPSVWDANYIWLRSPGAAGAPEVAAIADDVMGRAGLAHRYVLVGDQAAGDALTSGFLEMGWHAMPYVVMVHRHVRLLGDPSAAHEAPAADVAQARRDILLEHPWATPQVAAHILAREELIDGFAAGRHFVAECEGVVASHCQLWQRHRVAQVESVTTSRRFRNRGLARAVVSLATLEGRRSADLVFLLADGTDWPQYLYRRLGYETIGVLHRFSATLPEPPPPADR